MRKLEPMLTTIPEPRDAILYLQEFINTMQQVIDYNKFTDKLEEKANFDMSQFITPNNNRFSLNDQQHFCGTTACICGYQAIVENPEYTAIDILTDMAMIVADKLKFLLGNDLAISIYNESFDVRNEAAIDAGLFHDSFPHLQLDTSTPEDAIEYMQYIQTICKEQM